MEIIQNKETINPLEILTFLKDVAFEKGVKCSSLFVGTDFVKTKSS
jgi:hypothetical protein